MCNPKFFDVIHKNLNYHMKMITSVDKQKADMQYWNLTHLLKNIGMSIDSIEPKEGLVDMVFAANGALLKHDTAVISNFNARSRIPESLHWRNYLHDHGYNIHFLKSQFEGQGDALFSHNYKNLWMGFGFRTELYAEKELQDIFPETTVNALKLVDPRFYHLDTGFCVLKETMVMYYSPAFDTESQDKIKKKFEVCIDVSNEDAMNFACNAVHHDKYVILHHASNNLKKTLSNYDLTVVENNMSEFLLSGGSVKCCVLQA